MLGVLGKNGGATLRPGPLSELVHQYDYLPIVNTSPYRREKDLKDLEEFLSCQTKLERSKLLLVVQKVTINNTFSWLLFASVCTV